MAKFVYLNVNPEHRKISDCVTRAISLSTNTPYRIVRKKLYHTAKLLDCEKLCHTCYSHLIEQVFKCTPMNCDGMTLGEFADLHPYGTFLVRMNGHISTIINNTCFDIWDCRKVLLTNAWQVKK